MLITCSDFILSKFLQRSLSSEINYFQIGENAQVKISVPINMSLIRSPNQNLNFFSYKAFFPVT
jgi:hypothetical protein